MKTYYEEPEIGVISFSVEDVITVSEPEIETEPERDENELPMVPMPNAN